MLLAAAAPTLAVTTKTVIPTETSEILYNPGMGFATFHFAWGRLVPFSEYPTARIAYLRWHWSELEPQPGMFNFKLIDATIAKARARNQDLAFRIMPGIPTWLAAMGVGQVGLGVDVLPDHNHPLFVSYHERLIQAIGERYSPSLDIDHVDIGSVGCWGEWNSACCPAGLGETCKRYMPTQALRDATVNWYYKYFRDTSLVALASGAGYPNSLGAGWRGDCFGDYGTFSKLWNHMNDIYPPIVKDPTVLNAWQQAPIQFEACGTIKDWYARGFNIDTILQKGLDWHVSVFNGKDGPIPPQWRPKFDAWLKNMGYRFVLAKLSHTNDAVPGATIEITATWINRGVAPAYRRWPIVYRVRSTNGIVVAQWKSTANIRSFLPGSWPTQDSFQLPANVTPGTYFLDAAIMREDSSRAYVELANSGKLPDLWYQVSQMRVVASGETETATSEAPSGNTPSGTPWVQALSPMIGHWNNAIFTATYVHTGGASQHYLAYLLLLPSPNIVTYTATGSCLIEYNRISNGVRLIDNAGTAWLGGVSGVPITAVAKDLQNKQCTVQVSKVKVKVDGTTLTLTVPVLMESLRGVVGTFLQSADVNNNWTGMTQFGHWLVPGATATRLGPSVDTVSPATGSGSAATFTVTARHSANIRSLSQLHVLIHDAIGSGGCHVVYMPATNTANLINDSGTDMAGPWLSPGAGSVQNSRCMLSGTGMTATVSDSGRQLSVTMPLSFKASTFRGVKQVYANVFDDAGLLSHWIKAAVWTVQ